MWGTEWPRFEVIKQDVKSAPPQMVGSVHAVDPEHALLIARHVFVRRPAAYALWVAPAEAFYGVTREGLKDPPPPEGPPGVYWVFAKKSQRRSMVYGDLVGRYGAENPLEAIRQALLEVQGYAFWAVPEALLHGTEPKEEVLESWFTPAKEKTYRLQSYYGLVTAKEEKDG